MNKFRLVFVCLLLTSTILISGCTENIQVPPYTVSQFVNQTTDANYTIFKLNGYDGMCVVVDGNKLNFGNCAEILFDANLSGSVGQIPFVNVDGNALELDSGFDYNKTSNTLTVTNINTTNLIPYNGANQNINLGVNDFNVYGNTVQGSSSIIPAPASGSLSFDYTQGDNYYNYGINYVYTVYAYKVVNGIKIYSSGLALSGTDNGMVDSFYEINLAWSAVTGVDGYKIVMTADEWVYSFDEFYFETISTSLVINDPLGMVGFPDPEFVYEYPIIVTPNTILTHHNIIGDLNVGGDLVVEGSSFSVGTSEFVVNDAGKVGIGTATPMSMLNINQTSTGLKGLTITGYGLASTSPTSEEGVAVILNYNALNNRQLILGATDAIGSSTKGMFRFLTGGTGYAAIDSVSGDGANRLLTILGTDTTNVGVGYPATVGTGIDYTGRLNVFTSTNSGARTNLLIKKFGTASGDYIDVKNASNVSLLKMDSTGKVGIGTVTPAQALDVTGRGYLRQVSSSSPLAWDFVQSGGATMATFFVAGATNQFLTGAVAGDSGFRAMGGKFLIGAGPTAGVEPAVAMTVETDGEIRFPKDYVSGGAGSLLFGAGGDASMGYNGTDFIINPKVVGNGKVVIAGDLSVDGNSFVSVPFGELNSIDSLVTIGSANKYYSVDVNAGLLNGFSLVDENLVATYSGIYSVNSQWSFSGGVTNEYHLTLYKNGVIERKCHAERVLGTGGDVGSASFTCLVELDAGDTLSPKIENATAGNNANVHDLQLTVVRIGN